MSIESSAVEKLSSRVNVSAGLSHPSDECAAKELFKELVARGHTLDSGNIYSAALSNGWADRHAKKLGDLAGKITSGGRVVIKHKNLWNPAVFDEVEANS